MSDNPFAESKPVQAEISPPDTSHKRPGALNAILIVCIVLGVLGIFGSCIGIGGLAAQDYIATLPGQDDPMNVKMRELQKPMLIPNIIMMGLNCIIAPLLLIGGIGGLNRKGWAYGLLKFTLLAATIYVLIRGVVSTVLQFGMMSEMKTAVLEGLKDQPNMNPQAAEMAGNMAQIFGMVGLGFGVVVMLILAGFYFWGWNYLRKDNVKAHFGIARLHRS